MEPLTKDFGTLISNIEVGKHDCKVLSNEIQTSTNDLETITRGRWEWQSNPNPWDKKEIPQWESYSLEHNYLIEKAYYDKRDEIDTGDYIISIKHMIQKQKGYITKQRPIRRISWVESAYEIDRSARYFETELPKTMNKLFGNLGDFVSFFSKRNPEILELTNHFKELELSLDVTILNQKITPELTRCLEEVLLKPNEEQLKEPSLSKIKKNLLFKKIERTEELIGMFKKDLLSLEEFYGSILRAYTMNTDLYQILNNCLRNENWVEIDKLLPYAFCLCKAFFNLRFKTDLAQEKKIVESETLTSRLLYRGTAFDEFTLSFYNKEKVQYFSWNSVTSTSKEKKKAEDFMYLNANIPNKKYPILFEIEIPLTNESETEYLKWIDIHQYSVIPKEDEVVLAPGSVFELIEVTTDQDEKTTIKIKLRSEIKSLINRGMMMQGALHSQMMTQKEAKIMCLDGEELNQALESLCGNKLIEEIEFGLCTFDPKSLEIMFEILPTLKKANELKFRACSYQNNGEKESKKTQQAERCGITKIEVVEANNFFSMICNKRRNQEYWISLREVDLNFGKREFCEEKEFNNTVSKGLKYLFQLAHLKIDLNFCRSITDNRVNVLAQIFCSLPQLKYLILDFSWCDNITDEGIKGLAKGISSLTQLTHLNLDFKACKQITSRGMEGFAEGLSFHVQLTHLILDFGLCRITDKEVKSITQSFSFVNQLTHLNMSFAKCGEITSKEVKTFAQQLSSLTHLKHLDLNFRGCVQIYDEGLEILAEEIRKRTDLTYLNINFEDCDQITDEGVNSLAKVLNSLAQLTHLNLGFKKCNKITPEGMESLAERLSFRFKMTHLNLDFGWCTQIIFEGVKELAKCLCCLNQLTHLNISFANCGQITDNEVITLSQQLSSLIHLQHLDLNFRVCEQITDEGVKILAEGLCERTELIHLGLDFSYCKEITFEGINILISQGLKDLTRLSSLTLDFSSCDQIAGQDLHLLACKWLHHVTQYGSLVVRNKVLQNINTKVQQKYNDYSRVRLYRESFDQDKHISRKEVSLVKIDPTIFKPPEPSESISTKDLIQTLVSIGKDPEISTLGIPGTFSRICRLTSLEFRFDSSRVITDEFIQSFSCQILRNSPHLKALALTFSYCEQLTDKGMGDLASYGLKSLTSLTSIQLKFFSCGSITYNGLISLASEGLRYLPQFKSLSLYFDYLTGEGFINFAWHGLRHLSQLESLDLSYFSQLEDEEVDEIVSKGLRNLAQLKFLTLGFYDSTITDQGVNKLVLQLVKNLPKLTFLNLDFEECFTITSFTIQNLVEVLRYFGFTQEIDDDY